MSGPVHTTLFLYKNGEKNLRFCESVHTDPHKNATKTEVFENAIKSGYRGAHSNFIWGGVSMLWTD